MDNQDNRQSIDEKVTIPVAAKALKVSTKTVHRYLEKGLLTKTKEGTRVYVQIDEIRSLLSGQTKIDKSPRVHEKDKITVDRTHYDGLLTRLGQLENERQYLLEYKTNLETKDKELSEVKNTLAKANSELTKIVQYKQDAEKKAKDLLDQQAEIRAKEKKVEDLRAEVERLKVPWWKRLFSPLK